MYFKHSKLHINQTTAPRENTRHHAYSKRRSENVKKQHLQIVALAQSFANRTQSSAYYASCTNDKQKHEAQLKTFIPNSQ